MSSLDDSEMMMESAFIFYCNLGLQFFIHMSKARIYAVKMLAGQNPITYSQFLGYQKIRDMLTKSKERCELIKGDSDLPYESAELYMDVMLEECSMMFKFYLNKPIEMSDICKHVDIRCRVNKDDYNKLFLTEFSPEDRKDMLDFQASMDERLEILYGQILVYNELGLDNHE